MESFIENLLMKRGYIVNHNAQSVIKMCDNWYANRIIEDFHRRRTIQGTPYELNRLNFAKRCCSDDAKLCEVLEVNAGAGEQAQRVNEILAKNEFEVQYRKQLEKTSAVGTAACYIRLDNAGIYSDGTIKGGEIRLNYVDADCFIPLTVVNDIVTEAAFSGSSLKGGRKQTTLVLFLLTEYNTYTAETHIFDEYGSELLELEKTITLGDVKPFAVLRNAEVNNLDDMIGYGLPKLVNAIPVLKALDLCYNVLFSDLDKAEKILLVNELLCDFDEKTGKPKMTPEQKKVFVFLGEKLPQDKEVLQEYNPIIRIDEITKCFELALSLLSMEFGYGTKKYSFENGQITTATEYVGERQDQMQELNRQRQEAEKYIQDICRAVFWFSNTFHGTTYDINAEILVDFDDSYVTDKETELERVRNDALQFDIPSLTLWYLMRAYSLTEKEAEALVLEKQEREEELEKDEESED